MVTHTHPGGERAQRQEDVGKNHRTSFPSCLSISSTSLPWAKAEPRRSGTGSSGVRIHRHSPGREVQGNAQGVKGGKANISVLGGKKSPGAFDARCRMRPTALTRHPHGPSLQLPQQPAKRASCGQNHTQSCPRPQLSGESFLLPSLLQDTGD